MKTLLELVLRPTALLALMCFVHTNVFGAMTSVTPPNGTPGVSASAKVIFTFDIGMDDLQTDVMFMDMSGGFPTAVSFKYSWNGSYTILTCEPDPTWPAGKTISWFLSGETLDLEEVSEFGSFTVAGGGGGGGDPKGTNAITSCVVSKMHWYVQESAAAPVRDPDQAYAFQALTSLASNRTVTAISVTAPTTMAVYNLSPNPLAQEYWQYADWQVTGLQTFDAKYPAGNYVFNLTSNAASQQVTVNLASGMLQPNAPKVINYAAAQAVDPTQPFVLSWEPFESGTANDFIGVSIGTNYNSPDFQKPNALLGTATSVTIPAGALKPGQIYDAEILFIRQQFQTNAGIATAASRSTATTFPISTKLFTEPAVRNGKFSFNIFTTPGQFVIVEASTNLLPNSWSPVLFTNPPGSKIRFTDEQPAARSRSFRVQ